MSGFGAFGKGQSAPSPSSSNLSASAPPFTIGRPLSYSHADPFVGLSSDSYNASVQYASSDPPSSLAVEPPYASTQYSVADTFYESVGPGQHYAYPVNSSGHSGFSLYSDLNLEFNSIPSSNPAAEYSCWNPLGTSFSAYNVYGGQCSDRVTSNPVEAGTYYPSHVPPSTANHTVPSSGLLDTFHIPLLNKPLLGEYNPNSVSLGDKGNGEDSIWKMSDWQGGALKESLYAYYSMGGSTIGPSTSRNYVNQGTYASEVLKTCEESDPEIGIHDNSKPFTYTSAEQSKGGNYVSAEQSNGGNFLGNIPTCMLPIHSGKEAVCSMPMAPEPAWKPQCLKPKTNHWDVQVGQSTSYRKWTGQPDSSLAGKESSFDLNMEIPSYCSEIPHMNIGRHDAANDASNINSSGPLLSSWGTVQYEAPQLDRQLRRNDQTFAALSPTYNVELPNYNGLSNHVDNAELPSYCSDIPHMNIGRLNAANVTSKINSSGPSLSSGGMVQLEAPQLDRQLGRNEQTFAALSPTSDAELPGYKGLSNHVDDEVHGFQDPSGNQDSFKVGFNLNDAFPPVHHFPEDTDQLNPAIDSPCWKGMSFHNVSPFIASEVVGTQLIKETETCSSLNFQGPKISHLDPESTMEGSFQKPNKKTEFLNNRHVDNIIAPIPSGNSITESSPRKHPSDDEENANSFILQKDLDCYAFSADNPKYRSGDCIAKETLSGSGCESYDLQQGLIKGVSTAEKGKTTVHAPVSSSSLPVSNISSMLCKLDLKASTKDIFVQGLVKAMHNLSELLLSHCSSNTCEINEEDNNRLKRVITNLIICTQQESSKEQATFPHNQKLREVDRPSQSQNGKLQQVKKALVNADEDQLNDHHSEEERGNNVNFGFKNLNLNPVPATCSNVDVVDADKITRAIKKVLIENLNEEETRAQSLMYKNLWLEAEAALCSLNFRARYNRIKIEMEKCQMNETTEDAASLEKLQRSVVSPKRIVEKFASENGSNISTKHIPDRLLDDAKFRIVGGREYEPLADSSSDVAMSRSKANSLYGENEKAQETTGDQNPDSSHCGFLSESRKCHTDSVMANFSSLKNQDDHSVSGVDPSKAKASADLNRENQIAHETNRHTSDMSPCDYSLLNTSCHADDVLARFHILKSRGDPSVYEYSHGAHPTSDATHYGSSLGSKSCIDNDMYRYLTQADLSVSEHTPAIMPSSKVSSDINNFPYTDTSSLPDNVMARLNILSSRCDGSVSENTLNHVALGTRDASNSDISHSIFSAEDTTSPPNDVMARLKILTSRSETGNKEEEISSSDLTKANELEKKLNDYFTADIHRSESSIKTTDNPVYDYLTKAHVRMSELDNAIAESSTSCPNIDEKLSVEVLSNLNNIDEPVTYLESKRQYWTAIEHLIENTGGESGVNSAFPNPAPSSSEIRFTLYDSHCSPEDDLLTQSYISSRPFKQNYSGFNDYLLSDWEDLGKEGLPSQMA